MGFPALDLGGFQRRTVIPASYITFVEGQSPGYTVQRILTWTSRLYSILRKRYASSIPFGVVPAQFDASGTSPPAILLSGIPTLGSLQLVLKFPVGGGLGTAQFQLSLDGGINFGTATPTAASVSLGFGITATFSNLGSYSTDNLYSAATPVPEIFLGWLTDCVSVDVLRKHGVNTQDPQITQVFDRYKEVIGLDPPGEVYQAANSKEGLFDLPDNDHDNATDISSGGPLWYTETSPYVAADIQEFYGRQEDANSFNGTAIPPTGSSGGR
jgi:hypothetical protein